MSCPGRGTPQILVAGVGNIFLGDDAFGSETVRRLLREPAPLPAGVRALDYGIGGVHLAYDLLNEVDLLVIVDAVVNDRPPGTVSVIEVDPSTLGTAPLDSHSMDPAAVLANLRRLGGTIPRTLILACEPADSSERLGLSSPVEAAVEPALRALRELVDAELGAASLA